MADQPLFVFVGVYADQEAAHADYEALRGGGERGCQRDQAQLEVYGAQMPLSAWRRPLAIACVSARWSSSF